MSITEPTSHNDPPQDEFVRRVFYSMIGGALKLAADEELSLKEVNHWVETATFHVLKDRGMKMREISEALDISMRKAANLSNQLKQNFLEPEREHTLPRRIEFMLWSEPLSRSRLLQVMEVDESELDDALEILVKQERVVLEDGRSPRYHIASPTRRIVGRSWMGRIDGLNNLMNSAYGTIRARFFDQDERAFARTIQFSVRPEDLPKLQQLYEEKIWPELAELDRQARDAPNPVAMDLSILWAPTPSGNTND